MLYTIEDKTLTALGDAVREKTGVFIETITEAPEPFYTLDLELTYEDIEGKWNESSSYYKYNLLIPQIELMGEGMWNATTHLGSSYFYNNTNDSVAVGMVLRQYLSETHVGGAHELTFISNNRTYPLPHSYDTSYAIKSYKDAGNIWWELDLSIEKRNYKPTDVINLHLDLWAMSSSTEYLIPKKYTPLEMVEEINELNTIPEDALTITGNCTYKFSNNGWNWFIKSGGDKITTTKISNAEYMFDNSNQLEEIPFEINLNDKTSVSFMFNYCPKLKKAPKINGIASKIGHIFSNCVALTEIPDITCDNSTYSGGPYVFNQCNELRSLPYLYNFYPAELTNLLDSCKRLREIPEDWCDTWNWNRIHTYSYSSCGKTFNACSSLRKIPTSMLNNMWNVYTSSYGSMYNQLFYNCFTLDEINGLGISTASVTSNLFSMSFSKCHRIKNFTFQTNEDGTPKTAKWKSQTLDFSVSVGYSNSPITYITTLFNSGITADKEVKDDATYQALKNDADWFTLDINYSRYNHDSAVNTINSLPDCSATGTNTIKFTGASGALTDGGAINTLTEEEIAVATAKGWTVSLV
jgi:hypothetical protein